MKLPKVSHCSAEHCWIWLVKNHERESLETLTSLQVLQRNTHVVHAWCTHHHLAQSSFQNDPLAVARRVQCLKPHVNLEWLWLAVEVQHGSTLQHCNAKIAKMPEVFDSCLGTCPSWRSGSGAQPTLIQRANKSLTLEHVLCCPMVRAHILTSVCKHRFLPLSSLAQVESCRRVVIYSNRFKGH